MKFDLFSTVLLSTFFSLILSSFTEEVALVVLSLLIFSQMFMSEMVTWGLFIDPMSWSMVALTLFVSACVTFTSSKSGSKMPFFILLSMAIVVFFFLTNSLVYFFVLFEMSLIPLTFLLLTWGRQAERLLATQFMLIYTIVGSAPLLFFVFWKISESESSSLFLLTHSLSSEEILLWISTIAFFVKIPVFFFHSWLPKAHVEAPLEGSMILAGIMLKVGSFGLIRVLMMFDLPMSILSVMFCISLLGSLLSSVISLSSDDMKMSVAFSSISHMNMLVAAIFSMKMSGATAAVVIMVAHGICSPFLFYLVTKIYLFTHSRSMVISKGVFSKAPFFWFLGLMIWVINISAPPFFSFLGELMGFSSILSFFVWSGIWVILFLVSGSFYSIVNFGVQSHSSFKLPSKGEPVEDLMFPLLSVIGMILSMILFIFPPLLFN